jgi:hypothetical protein
MFNAERGANLNAEQHVRHLISASYPCLYPINLLMVDII